jgi:phage-related protein
MTKVKEPDGVSGTGAVNPNRPDKRLPAIFFRTRAGREPVRAWLKTLPYADDRKRIGEDIKTVEFGWPIGMPVCRPMGQGIYEVRTDLMHNRIARVLFYIDGKHRMVLLHGFIKKTRQTPDGDLALARRNKEKHERGLQ